MEDCYVTAGNYRKTEEKVIVYIKQPTNTTTITTTKTQLSHNLTLLLFF